MNSTQKDESVGFFDFFLRQILRKLGKLRKWMNQSTRWPHLGNMLTRAQIIKLINKKCTINICIYTYQVKFNVILRAKWAQIHYLNLLSPSPKKSCGALISYQIHFQLLILASYECEWVWAWLVTRVNNLITCIFYHKVFRQMQTRVLQPHWEIIIFLEFDQSEQSRS